jgi:hypothetical protein
MATGGGLSLSLSVVPLEYMPSSGEGGGASIAHVIVNHHLHGDAPERAYNKWQPGKLPAASLQRFAKLPELLKAMRG